MTASKFDHLRHRPFLVIESFVRPNGSVRTERNGWQGTGSGRHEHPSIVQRVSNTTMRKALVIIDLLRDRVIKSPSGSLEGEVLAYYKDKYPDMFQVAR